MSAALQSTIRLRRRLLAITRTAAAVRRPPISPVPASQKSTFRVSCRRKPLSSENLLALFKHSAYIQQVTLTYADDLSIKTAMNFHRIWLRVKV